MVSITDVGVDVLDDAHAYARVRARAREHRYDIYTAT